jgi:hypothetical protein
MEFSLNSVHSYSPVEVTVDDDNGRYMIRNADTSGEVFNTSNELISWIKQNWQSNEFCTPQEFETMLKELDDYLQEGISI